MDEGEKPVLEKIRERMKQKERSTNVTPEELWSQAREFLRRHGYEITREEFERPEQLRGLLEGLTAGMEEKSPGAVGFVIHEAVETEEIFKETGEYTPPWRTPDNVLEKAHEEAERMYLTYFEEKEVPLPPAMKELKHKYEIA